MDQDAWWTLWTGHDKTTQNVGKTAFQNTRFTEYVRITLYGCKEPRKADLTIAQLSYFIANCQRGRSQTK